MSLVLDASMTLAWLNTDSPHGDIGAAVLERLRSSDAVVPGIWPLEVGNALLKQERAGMFSDAEVEAFLEYLVLLPIEIEAQDVRRDLFRVRSLARRYGLSTYDASYLDLAIRTGFALATLDQQLARAGRSAGCDVISL